MSDLPYDPEARRDTPLALKIKSLIRERGPLPISRYWQLCLSDREHGYYRTRPAVGRSGDFVTAPEISQVFGELIGLWSAVVWQQMGSPSALNLVELGPGRGTMMRDMLRAAALVPGFVDALRIHLVEQNEALRAVQARTLGNAGVPICYVDGDALPGGASIVLGNEYLDCLPVGQVQWHAQDGEASEWRMRAVGLDDGDRLQFVSGPPPYAVNDPALSTLPAPRHGDILEDRRVLGAAGGLAAAASGGPLAALFVDYGHTQSGYGDTLQAVRDHRPEHPLTSPGEADLTSQVDFAAFGAAVETAARSAGAAVAVDGPATQAEFLGRLGIMERASRLMAANPAKAAAIEMGVARLMAVPGMGSRFKAIGVRSAALPPLPGF